MDRKETGWLKLRAHASEFMLGILDAWNGSRFLDSFLLVVRQITTNVVAKQHKLMAFTVLCVKSPMGSIGFSALDS